MRERRDLHQVRVDGADPVEEISFLMIQLDCDGLCDLGYFDGVRKSISKEIRLNSRKELSFAYEPAEGSTMNQARVVTPKLRPMRFRFAASRARSLTQARVVLVPVQTHTVTMTHSGTPTEF